MCDPTIMAVAGMASGVANAMGQANAAAKQKQSYDEWFAMQEQNRKDQNAKQEASRKQAEAAQQAGVQAVSGTTQTANQQAEASRLTDALNQQSGSLVNPAPSATSTPGVDTSIADKSLLLSGQQYGGKAFQEDAASKLAAAATAAKERIAALATTASFGNSQFGMQNSSNDALMASALGINQANSQRQGDLSVYGIQQKVDPVSWSFTPGPTFG